MSVKQETVLQQRIQRLIESRGGYVNKNWGSMISEPGIADLTVCYKGFYLAVEVKVGHNRPSQAQGIHARDVKKAWGMSIVVWSEEEVKKVLDLLDEYANHYMPVLTRYIYEDLDELHIDDGTRY